MPMIGGINVPPYTPGMENDPSATVYSTNGGKSIYVKVGPGNFQLVYDADIPGGTPNTPQSGAAQAAWAALGGGAFPTTSTGGTPPPLGGSPPPLGGSQPPAGGPIVGGTVGMGLTEADPTGMGISFLNMLKSQGLNAGIGGGTFGKYLQGQFDPLQNLFEAQNALNPPPAGTVASQTPFGDYAKNILKTTGFGGLGALAGTTFGQLAEAAKTGVTDNPNLTAFISPTAENNASDFAKLVALAKQALAGKMGGWATNQLMPSFGSLYSQFQTSPYGGQSQQFLPWLQKQFKL